MKDLNALQKMIEQYRNLPYGSTRVTLVQQALALAEKLGLPFYLLDVQYDMVWTYALADDPAKALPACARFFTLLEEYPGVLTPEVTSRDAISVAMIAAHVAGRLPQIPLEQYRELIEQFHEQVRRYGVGERLWQMHASFFCLRTGDLAGAESHLQSFWDTPRDALSDCEACEISSAAEILLRLGYREKARQTVQPVLDGTKRCTQQPWSVLTVLIHDAIAHGELKRAKTYGRQLTRHPITNTNDLDYIGTLLYLYAHTGQMDFVHLLEQGITWSVGVWDQDLLFDFYHGAWEYCAKLGEQKETLSLSLPAAFPLYQEDGVYSCAGLARWFKEQTEVIARRFDRRNGSNYYGRKLRPANVCQ